MPRPLLHNLLTALPNPVGKGWASAHHAMLTAAVTPVSPSATVCLILPCKIPNFPSSSPNPKAISSIGSRAQSYCRMLGEHRLPAATRLFELRHWWLHLCLQSPGPRHALRSPSRAAPPHLPPTAATKLRCSRERLPAPLSPAVSHLGRLQTRPGIGVRCRSPSHMPQAAAAPAMKLTGIIKFLKLLTCFSLGSRMSLTLQIQWDLSWIFLTVRCS